MLGQSWTRYAYMSLVHLLEVGSVPVEQPRKSVCWERSWIRKYNETKPRWLERAGDLNDYGQQWAHFFHGTNAIFSSAGGREVCDCSRRSMAEPHQENRFYEQRTILHRNSSSAGRQRITSGTIIHDHSDSSSAAIGSSSSSGGGSGGDESTIRVSYFFTVGRQPVHGFADPKKAATMDGIAKQLAWCEAGICTLNGRGSAWNDHLVGLMQNKVAPLKPDVLLWSSDYGPWPSCGLDHHHLKHVLDAGNATLRPGGLALVKSRSPQRLNLTAKHAPNPRPNHRDCYKAPCGGISEQSTCRREKVANEAGWTTLDHFELIRSLYEFNTTVADESYVAGDQAHHRCFVNNELINLMLNHACG